MQLFGVFLVGVVGVRGKSLNSKQVYLDFVYLWLLACSRAGLGKTGDTEIIS